MPSQARHAAKPGGMAAFSLGGASGETERAPRRRVDEARTSDAEELVERAPSSWKETTADSCGSSGSRALDSASIIEPYHCDPRVTIWPESALSWTPRP